MRFLERKLVTAPTKEPISLSSAKQYLRIDTNDEDLAISEAIKAARVTIEHITNRALINQTWDVFSDSFPGDDCIELPLGRLQQVASFSWTDSGGTTRTWTVSGSDLVEGSIVRAHIDTVREPGEIRLAYNQTWPTHTLKTANPIKIRASFGYGSDANDVPANLVNAVKLMTSHFFDKRDLVVLSDRASVTAEAVPFTLGALAGPERLNVL